MSDKKSKKNTKRMVLAGGTLALAACIAVLFELGYISDIMTYIKGKKSAQTTTAPDDEPTPDDNQISDMLKRLEKRDAPAVQIDTGLVNSLKNYRDVVAARKKNQKTK